MPMFEYICRACGETFEELRSASPDEREPECPACGSKDVVKLFSSFATATAGAPRGRGSSGSCGSSRRFT